MVASLANTTFSTGVDDTLSTKDIYAEDTASKDSVVAKEATELTDAELEDITGKIIAEHAAQNPPSLTEIDPAVELDYRDRSDFLAGRTKVMPSSDMLSGILGQKDLLGGFGLLSKQFKDALQQPMGVTKISAMIAGISTIIGKSNLSNLTGITDMIRKITGSEYAVKLLDVTGTSSLITNILVQANKLGIPNAYAQMAIGLLTNPNILNQVTKGILPAIIAASNYKMLGEVAKGPARRAVTTLQPNVIRNFSKGFTLPKTTAVSQYPAIATSIAKSYAAIDPNWNKVRTPTGVVTNTLAALKGASPDMIKVMSSVRHNIVAPAAVSVSTTKALTAAQVAVVPATVYPAGTTQTSSTLSSGVVKTTHTLPTGAVVVEELSPDGSKVVTSTYPTQIAPAPQVTNDSVAMVVTPTPTAYAYPTSTVLESKLLEGDEIGTPPPEVGTSYPAGTIVVQNTLEDGSIQKVATTTSGNKYLITTDQYGVVEISSIVVASNDSLPSGMVDPLESTLYGLQENPLALGAVINDFQVQSADVNYNPHPDYLSMGSTHALNSAFNKTYLANIQDIEELA